MNSVSHTILFRLIGILQGRTDVGYAEGNLQTPTPNIDKLANKGVIMDRFYTNSICTPSRAAYMSGKYVFQTGIPSLNCS